MDILSAAAALTAVGLTIYDFERFRAADHYGGFVVGIVVIITGLRVLRDASLELMDTMPDARMMELVRRAALAVDGVRGVDKAYARKTGLSVPRRLAHRGRSDDCRSRPRTTSAGRRGRKSRPSCPGLPTSSCTSSRRS